MMRPNLVFLAWNVKTQNFSAVTKRARFDSIGEEAFPLRGLRPKELKNPLPNHSNLRHLAKLAEFANFLPTTAQSYALPNGLLHRA